MEFVDIEYCKEFFRDKTVALFGSAPSCYNNDCKAIDKHDLIVRVNNFVYNGHQEEVGHRTDVFYSFFGSSVKKDIADLKNQGVKLCMSKLPNDKPFESEWHKANNMPYGVDYRYVYKKRAPWWFCDTYVPETEHFMELFNLLGQHQPTTGFSAIWELLQYDIKSLYITGYDFFRSKMHNGNQKWRAKNHDDPYKHVPEREAQLLGEWAKSDPRIRLDRKLRRCELR
jgi:hypothetical protein